MPFFWGAFFFLCFDAKKNPGDPFRKKREALREALCTGKKKDPKGSEKEIFKKKALRKALGPEKKKTLP